MVYIRNRSVLDLQVKKIGLRGCVKGAIDRLKFYNVSNVFVYRRADRSFDGQICSKNRSNRVNSVLGQFGPRSKYTNFYFKN